MQHNGQQPQEYKDLPLTTEQPKQEDEPKATPISAQGEQQLPAEQQKAEEYLDLLRRTQADFLNYRSRMSQEQAEGCLTVQSELLCQILPIFDDFGWALGAVPSELTTDPWVQGLFLIMRKLTTLLDQLGVQQIGAPGELFDPRRHEAIMTEAQADIPEGTILHVAQPGYTIGERVIRPAQVSVASAASPMSDAPA